MNTGSVVANRPDNDSPPRGRRPGAESSRGAVLAAARRLFAEHGFDSTSVRSVAAAAGVDPAVVFHFFATKQRLLEVVLEELETTHPLLLDEVAAAPRARQGAALTSAYLRYWQDGPTAETLQALLRGAIGSSSTADTVRRFLNGPVFAGPTHDEYAAAGSMLLGIAVTRFVLRTGPLATMPLEDLVRIIAPSVQLQIDTATGRPSIG